MSYDCPMWLPHYRDSRDGLWATEACTQNIYRKTFNMSCTLVGNKIVDHSDVVGAPPVGAAPTTSSFLT